MKSLSVVLVFAISLACARGEPGYKITEQHIKECGATNTLQRSPYSKILNFAYSGADLQLKAGEKCFLLCLLKKSSNFDAKGNLSDGLAYVKLLLQYYPEIAKYSDVLMAQIFHISRLAKSIDDDCERAFATYQHIYLAIMALRMAKSIENVTHIKDITINTVETGLNLNQKNPEQVKEYFKFFETLMKDEATWETMTSSPSTRPFCKVSKSMKTMSKNPSDNVISRISSTKNC